MRVCVEQPSPTVVILMCDLSSTLSEQQVGYVEFSLKCFYCVGCRCRTLDLLGKVHYRGSVVAY